MSGGEGASAGEGASSAALARAPVSVLDPASRCQRSGPCEPLAAFRTYAALSRRLGWGSSTAREPSSTKSATDRASVWDGQKTLCTTIVSRDRPKRVTGYSKLMTCRARSASTSTASSVPDASHRHPAHRFAALERVRCAHSPWMRAVVPCVCATDRWPGTSMRYALGRRAHLLLNTKDPEQTTPPTDPRLENVRSPPLHEYGARQGTWTHHGKSHRRWERRGRERRGSLALRRGRLAR